MPNRGVFLSVEQNETKPARQHIFITHAAPEENDFAIWLASKLTLMGYKVWVDRRRLLGGDDFWLEIERVLRNEAVKQIVTFGSHVRKPGVQKELALGAAVAAKLGDPAFMIPIRIAEVDYSSAPVEFIRANILEGWPNWHDCLTDLLETLRERGVLANPTGESGPLEELVRAREEGRRSVSITHEQCLTNWFSISKPPAAIRYFKFTGHQDQAREWLSRCLVPYVPMGLLAGTFADKADFKSSCDFNVPVELAYEVPISSVIDGSQMGPYVERSALRRDVVNLLRQHMNAVFAAKGLAQYEFANGELGWFFPDGINKGQKVQFTTPYGHSGKRVLSGKFKSLRWHMCLVAKPRLFPEPIYRMHGNVIFTEDGKTPLKGEVMHRKRRRATRSWWNDIWRDRLLSAIAFMSGGEAEIKLQLGSRDFCVSAFPIVIEMPIRYDGEEEEYLSEEDSEGNIEPTAELDRISGYDESDEEADTI